MPTGFAYLRYHRSALGGNCCWQLQRNASSTKAAFARCWRVEEQLGPQLGEACSQLERAAKLSRRDTGHINTTLIPPPLDLARCNLIRREHSS